MCGKDGECLFFHSACHSKALLGDILPTAVHCGTSLHCLALCNVFPLLHFVTYFTLLHCGTSLHCLALCNIFPLLYCVTYFTLLHCGTSLHCDTVELCDIIPTIQILAFAYQSVLFNSFICVTIKPYLCNNKLLFFQKSSFITMQFYLFYFNEIQFVLK